MSILTGQIDLTKLQNNLGVGLKEFVNYIHGHASVAIQHYVTYNIVTYSVALVFTIIVLVYCYNKVKKIEDEDLRVALIIVIICCLGFGIFIFNILLSRWISPEMSIIKEFIINK